VEPVQQAVLHDGLAADQLHFDVGLVPDQGATEQFEVVNKLRHMEVGQLYVRK
jgi:hypothetical protein